MASAQKKHWFRNTLWTLIVCGVAGVILAVILFQANPGKTSASTSILFSFNGAAKGLAPNGYTFDVSGITSDEVLEEALTESGLEGTYTPEEVRKNMTVTGVYPEDIVEEMTRYNSLLDAGAGSQAVLSDYRATQYSVVLYDSFGETMGKEKLTQLLSHIMEAYQSYFRRVFAVNMSDMDQVSEMSGLDYIQQLELIGESVAQQGRVAQEMVALAPAFRYEGRSFSDIPVRYSSLNGEISRLSAQVVLNAISREPEQLKNMYEMDAATLKTEIASLEEELNLLDGLASGYEKDGIIYISTNGSLQQLSGSVDSIYDRLITERNKLKKTIGEKRAEAELYESRLTDLTGGEAAAEEEPAETAKLTKQEKAALEATMEEKINSIREKKDAVARELIEMLNAYSDEEINDDTLSVKPVTYTAPKLLSGSFAMKAVKTAAPLCAAGLMVCLALMIISRIRDDRKKQ